MGVIKNLRRAQLFIISLELITSRERMEREAYNYLKRTVFGETMF